MAPRAVGRAAWAARTPAPGRCWSGWQALRIWEGGLGIWGAVALGGVGAWIGCRRRGIQLPAFSDAVAPGIAVAQALGRWGNYFNQGLFGRPTDLPWALQIDPGRRPEGSRSTTRSTRLSEDMVAELTKCIRTNTDCADVCDTTGRVLSRHTGYDANLTRSVLEACAAACKACGDECAQHAEMHEHCRVCAESCRRCEQACRDLISSLG